MYQLNLDKNTDKVYSKYKDISELWFTEQDI